MERNSLEIRSGGRCSPVMMATAFLLLFQAITGLLLFYQRTEMRVAGVYEYYAGSEKMLILFPQREDRFIMPKSIPGLLKASIAHLGAYAFLIFISIHKLMLLKEDGKAPKKLVGLISISLLSSAICDLFSPFLAMHWQWGAYTRLFATLSFAISMAAAAAVILNGVIRRKSI